MADGFTLDASDGRRLAGELSKIPARAVPGVEAVLKKGADNLKKGMAKEFEASEWFRRIGRTVSYERRGFARDIAYEIGPEIGGAGSLAGVAVNGGANGGGGSVDIDKLLEPEAAAVEKYLTEVLGDLL